jgi:uncharacterized protein (TIGR03000 family)
MTRRKVAIGGALLVAAALVFLTPAPGQARPHGGFGGFHGGLHYGGAHFGGLHYGGLHYGGLHYGGFHPYYHYGYHPYYHYGYRHGYWPNFYAPNLYGYYPYYSNYYPYDGFGDVASYPYYSTELGSGMAYDSAADSLASTSVGGGTVLSSYSSSSTPAQAATTAAADTTAHVTVNLPADARLWFDDTPTTVSGAVREFHSPSLTPGSSYYYEVRASWNENGREATQTQIVKVAAGGHVRIDFPLPPEAAGQPPTARRD